MKFARDLGAAMTFGLSITTKHKKAETKYENRRKQHEGHLNAYNEVQAQVRDSLEAMDAHFAAALEILLSSGALTSDVSSNLIHGWYRPLEEVDGVENNPDYARSFIGAIPAFGLGIGTPAAIWTLVGIYGTAATGTAIGALSGAAVGAATAAWIGRATTLGGMTAGRIALGPIGVAASLVTLPLGAALARNRERNYIQQTDKAAHKMDCCEEIIERARSRMKPLLPRMAVTTGDLQRHTSRLKTATPNTPYAQCIVHKLDIDMREAVAIKHELVDIASERDDAMKAAGFTNEC